MPDTGEDREIEQRVNAKEAVRVAESKRLSQKTKKDNAIGRTLVKSEKGTKPRVDKSLP